MFWDRVDTGIRAPDKQSQSRSMDGNGKRNEPGNNGTEQQADWNQELLLAVVGYFDMDIYLDLTLWIL